MSGALFNPRDLGQQIKTDIAESAMVIAAKLAAIEDPADAQAELLEAVHDYRKMLVIGGWSADETAAIAFYLMGMIQAAKETGAAGSIH